jgi:hypothetical protein
MAYSDAEQRSTLHTIRSIEQRNPESRAVSFSLSVKVMVWQNDDNRKRNTSSRTGMSRLVVESSAFPALTSQLGWKLAQV